MSPSPSSSRCRRAKLDRGQQGFIPRWIWYPWAGGKGGAMRRLLMGVLLAAAMGAAPAVRAQEGAGPVTLGGVAVLQFRASAGGFTPEARAQQLQERVVE